ncbi:MAG: NAD(P)H-dependent oxidoreductase [Paenibacillaceae bacterium]|jgi:multimeric flavodoxin WrbA|nr:NAD(P)H-dependent oxidoreductase [Paenibacillaceae bacterium]
MNYLIINGSPHKGNTWKVVEQAKLCIQQEDNLAEFAVIHLAELNLAFCRGCSACFRLGHEKCPHSGIMTAIIEKIAKADGVIFASATYNRRETALLKNLFDHLCFMLHRPYFFQSKALVITTTGGVGAKAAAKSIASFLKGIGFNRCYRFSVSTYSWNDYKITEAVSAKLHKITSKFCSDIASRTLHSPSCVLLIPYNLFRGMSLSYVKGTEYEMQDGVHWAEESRKRGVYDSAVQVPFYKKPIGQLFYIIGKIAGKKYVVTYKK